MFFVCDSLRAIFMHFDEVLHDHRERKLGAWCLWKRVFGGKISRERLHCWKHDSLDIFFNSR